jgi:hypothetical protein
MVRAYVETAVRPMRERVAALAGVNRTQSADGLEPAALATLAADPAERLYQGRIMYCTDCRKSGEGAGVGTGLPVYYDSSGATWRTFYDNSAAIS